MTTVQSAFAVRRENLHRLVLEKFDGNRAAFSRAAGVHQNQVNLLLSDNEAHRRNLGENLARKMERELGLETGYFDSLHKVSGATVPVRTGDVPPQLAHLLRRDDVVASVTYYESYLLSLGGKITSPGNLTICRVITHDMAPEITFDERVVIDVGVKAVSADGVYIIQHGNDCFLRRVTKNITGGYTILTPNPAHEALKVDTLKGIKAVGRVVMLLRNVVL